MGHNINTEFTWLTQREKHSRKKEQYVQKLGGRRMNSKDWKVPRVTTADGKGLMYWETWSRALRVCLLGMKRIMKLSFSILEAFQVDWSVFIHSLFFRPTTLCQNFSRSIQVEWVASSCLQNYQKPSLFSLTQAPWHQDFLVVCYKENPFLKYHGLWLTS